MEEFKLEDIKNNQEKQRIAPEDLARALNDLENNANSFQLRMFLKNNGIQKRPYELVGRMENDLHVITLRNIKRLEKDINDKAALSLLKLVGDTGVLTPEFLKKEIEFHINGFMARPAEIREQFAGVKGELSDKERQDFASEIESQIRENLGWNIQIDVKLKEQL